MMSVSYQYRRVQLRYVPLFFLLKTSATVLAGMLLEVAQYQKQLAQIFITEGDSGNIVRKL